MSTNTGRASQTTDRQGCRRLARTARSRRGRLAAGAAVVAIALAPAIALAASNSLKVTGPTSNTLGTNFNEQISGYAKGGANFVVAWEQYSPRSGCAATYAAESTRAFFPGTWGLTVWTHQSVSGKYSITARFGAVNPGRHGLCAYLINVSTGATYAHASIFWTNHS